MIPERVNCVVYYDQIFQLSVGYYSEIFDVNAFFGSYAVVSVESVLNETALRVEVIKYHICIGLMACSKHHYLVSFICLLEAVKCIRPNIDTSLHCFSIRKSHVDNLITRVVFYVVYAVNQCLIQIKYDCFLNYRHQ